jgi:HAE1 family hydrophobic/amphiphilic exporter-1
MTTLTTVLGLAPLALGESQLAVGTVGPSYAPMARAIMGGLAFGAIMSLFFVPALYVWLDDAAAATTRMLVRTRPGTAAGKAHQR